MQRVHAGRSGQYLRAGTPIRWLATGCLSSILLTGCTIAPQDTGVTAEVSGQAYAAEFDRARRDSASSPLAQKILEDNIISEQEMLELLDVYSACMIDNGVSGFTASLTGDGGNDATVTRAVYDAAESNCQKQTGYHAIEFLYRDIRENPSNYNRFEILVACFVRNRIVEPGYSPEQYHRETEAFFHQVKEQTEILGARPYSFIGDPVTAEWIFSECSRNSSFNREDVPEPDYLEELRRSEEGLPPVGAPSEAEESSFEDAGQSDPLN
ncbi:hypothetical protein [Schaalia canis]|uniref:Lipoprotein n=1 Tax=Schaalia canis TaxID=100469 RepID=A0A3P1SC72_9ACTO|nr:hypothetical protein [Schaalia canis]RRC94873.1 hypothetical protein EII11_08345 [Schaalia canis]